MVTRAAGRSWEWTPSAADAAARRAFREGDYSAGLNGLGRGAANVGSRRAGERSDSDEGRERAH